MRTEATGLGGQFGRAVMLRLWCLALVALLSSCTQSPPDPTESTATAEEAVAEANSLTFALPSGTTLTSCWVALVNGVVLQTWLRRGSGPLVVAKGAALGFVIVASTSVIGRWLVARNDAQTARLPMARMGVVQLPRRASPSNGDDSFRAYRDASVGLVNKEPKLELLLWPETALATPVRTSDVALLSDALHRNLAEGAAQLGVPVLTGVSSSLRSTSLDRRSLSTRANVLLSSVGVGTS